ncbi:hypothetical protein AVEN_221313-1 [Araneus ventricosus]|uniref:Uncharacterized protein n=1 Tax=Araneus ventricosus TaxID=182803 RepID=A0A4Y2B1Z3_ARAVE|nr:hypothetical protein AVEN_221313-1 [Araneus ventricosus]
MSFRIRLVAPFPRRVHITQSTTYICIAFLQCEGTGAQAVLRSPSVDSLAPFDISQERWNHLKSSRATTSLCVPTMAGDESEPTDRGYRAYCWCNRDKT